MSELFVKLDQIGISVAEAAGVLGISEEECRRLAETGAFSGEQIETLVHNSGCALSPEGIDEVFFGAEPDEEDCVW